MPWSWRFEKADGRAVDAGLPRETFTTQADAETWLGESWRELAEGIATALADDDSSVPLAHLLDAGLRPDVVMQILLEVLGEQALGALTVLDTKVPNTNHRMIARLARNGGLRHVLTANLDRLIEIACEEAGVPVRVIVTHLGLSPSERRAQVTKLLAALSAQRTRLTMVMCDLNEWWPRGRPLR